MDGRRILFVSHSAAISGAEVILLELARHAGSASAFVFQPGALVERLRGLGLPVKTSARADGVSAATRAGSIWTILPLAGRFAAIMREIAGAASGHGVIYANSQKAFVLSALVASFLRKPLIWHLHDIPDHTHFGGAQLKLQIFLANRCARRIIVPSDAVRRAFVAAGGAEALVRIVPNGVPLPRPDGRTRQELRSMLGLPDGPLVGVFSRLARWKGQHVLLEALARLPDVRGVIAGTALFEEDAYAQELQSTVERLGLADRIGFLGHRDDIPDLMRAVDIVIHPSIAPEPFGLTVVEGMLACSPVIGTAAGAIPEILDRGQAGWLVAPDDAVALSGAISEIFASTEEVERRVAHARRRAETHYSAERMVREITALIDEVSMETSS